VNRAKVLRARSVMLKPDDFNGRDNKPVDTFEVHEDVFIEEFLPRVLQDRSTVIVVDSQGNSKGQITEKELANALKKSE